MTIKKIIRNIHLWLGLISGLVVFVLGITGAIYAFSDEIKDWVYAERLHVEVPSGGQKLPLNQLYAIAEQALPEGHRISRAELSESPGRSYMFRALKLNRKAFGYWNYYTYYEKVYLNPYTGKILYVENSKYEFFTLILALHMNLLLGDQVGYFVVCCSVVCFLLLLLTGMVLWWPKNWKRKQLRKSFSIKWGAKFKRLNYDLHNVTGFYLFLPLILISVTGLMWSFGLTKEPKKTVLSDTTRLVQQPKQVAAPWSGIFAQVRRSNPEAAYYLYNFPAVKAGTVNVSAYFREGNFYDKIQYRYDRYTGTLLDQDPAFAALGTVSKLKAMNYDLHTGSAFGFWGKLLALISGLIAAGLPVTGFLIWYKKGK